MLPDRPTVVRILLFLLLAALPYGEGGARPAALLIIHSVLLAAALLLVWPAAARIGPSLPGGLALPAGLFGLTVLAASIGSPYPYASFLRLLDFGSALLALAVAHGAGGDDSRRDRLVDGFLGIVALQAILMIGGWVAGDLSGTLQRLGLLNSNHEAAFLNLGVLLALPRLAAGGRTGRILRSVAALLALVASALMASRGGAAGLIAGLVVAGVGGFGSMPPGGRRRRVLILTVALVLLSAGLYLRFRGMEDPFRYRRVQIWSAVLRGAPQSPWLGVGPGIYQHVAQRDNFPLPGPVRYGRSFATAHSDYLGLLRETGIFGLAAGVFLLVAAGRAMRRRRREGADALSHGLPPAAAALVVQALVEDLSLRPALFLTFAILFGAATAPPTVDEARNPDPARRRGWVAAATILLGWLGAVWWPYRAYERDEAMRHAGSLPEMELRFRQALRANPYQAPTWIFPASAFLSARPEVPLTPELYSRFRDDLESATRVDRTSAEAHLFRGRLEVRAFRRFGHDAAIRDRAVAAYREAGRLAPHDPRIPIELAVFLREVGQAPDARREIESALREEPAYQLAHLLQVQLLLEGDDRQATRKAWSEAERNRAHLAKYRPESRYAADITRDHPALRLDLADKIPSP